MTDDDVRAFRDAMGTINLVYPRQQLASEAQVHYFDRLRRFALADVLRAIETAIDYGGDFPPSVARLIEMIEGSGPERAAGMWSRVHCTARAGYGTLRGLDFSDPVAHAAIVSMGGWARIFELAHRDSESVDRAVARREFIELYLMHLNRGIPSTTPPALCCEQERVGAMPPIRIGEFGEPEASAYPALPASTTPEPEPKYVDPPPEFSAALAKLQRKVALPPTPRERRPVPPPPTLTPAEAEAKQQRIREALTKAREAGFEG